MTRKKKEKWEKFASEYVVSLFPIFMLVNSFGDNLKKIISRECSFAFKIENSAIEYYQLPSNWLAAHLALVKKIRKSPLVLNNFFLEMERRGKELVDYTKILKNNLSNKSNDWLNNYYQKYVVENTKLYAYGLLLPLLDFQDTTFLSDEVNRILKIKKAAKHFQVLTTPSRETFNKQQELNLLKILTAVKKIRTLFKKFIKTETQQLINEIEGKNKKIWRLLLNHTKKYCWVYYVYEGPAADIFYFVEAIKDLINKKIEPQKKIINYHKEKKQLKSKQQKILHKIKADSYEKQIILLARDAVFFKAYRRELQSRAYYHLEFLLKEIAKRTNLTLKQVRMMLPNEVSTALLKNKINARILDERIKLVVYGRKNNPFCLVGKMARGFIKESIKRPETIRKTKRLIGNVAYQGRTKGFIKIINTPSEINKMKRGNILVSASTNPNLMSAIRQAAAIITDEGGLTCHAAIVARELRIPCVVGTKFATKILKDGEFVEVDAIKGVIKKI